MFDPDSHLIYYSSGSSSVKWIYFSVFHSLRHISLLLHFYLWSLHASEILSSAALKELEKKTRVAREKREKEKVMKREKADTEGAIKRTDDGRERNDLIYCVDFCTF